MLVLWRPVLLYAILQYRSNIDAFFPRIFLPILVSSRPSDFFLSLAWYIYSCTPNSWQFLYFYSNSGISRSHNVCHLSLNASRSHCINVHTFLGLALVLNPVSLESPPETVSVSIQTYIWPLASNHFLHILSQFLLVLDSKDACIFLHVLFSSYQLW